MNNYKTVKSVYCKVENEILVKSDELDKIFMMDYDFMIIFYFLFS